MLSTIENLLFSFILRVCIRLCSFINSDHNLCRFGLIAGVVSYSLISVGVEPC